MTTHGGSTLALVQSRQSAPLPPADRGRLLYVEDVSALLQGKRSAWWIRHRFAPAAKVKLGNVCAWWERDALAWIDSGGTR